ncbi:MULTISPECIES: universal stress protein [unclassified Arthrobacter]|uniref:universal stress protein n=1 Tax=unclassified Arthrobacter TaxID=235627 RepID=UPI0038D4CD48
MTETSRGAPLLVIGTRGLSGIPGYLRGSASQAVRESTSTTVLVVPSRDPHRNSAEASTTNPRAPGGLRGIQRTV